MPATSQAEPVRLQKYLSECGLGSRRACEQLIREGAVAVNGQTAVLGQRVDPGRDRVTAEGRSVRPPADRPASQRLTLVLNKPAGYTCDHEHGPEDLPRAIDLLPPELRPPGLRVAGELDTEAEGLVVFTNDGGVLQGLTHASSGVRKIYRVTFREAVAPERVARLIKGFVRDGHRYRALAARPLHVLGSGGAHDFEITLVSGAKSEIRWLVNSLREHVRRLRRVVIGGVALRRIPLRGWRVLGKHDRELLLKKTEAEIPTE